MKTVKSLLAVAAHLLFWSWNAIFLAFVLLGFAPLIVVQLVEATRIGLIPTEFLVFGAVMVAIPVTSIAVGVLALRNRPAALFALGYGVEGPLMLAITIRFFAFQELMPGAALLLALTLLGLAALAWQLLDARIDSRGALLACLRVAGLSALLVAGLYACAIVAFYALPVSLAVVDGIARSFVEMIRSLRANPFQAAQWLMFSVLGSALGLYTATLFVIMPIAVPIIYAANWWRGVRSLWSRFSRPLAVAIPAVAVALIGFGVLLTGRQPQHRAFELASQSPLSPKDAEALAGEQDAIRAGLLNAYLSSYRYLSSVGEVRHISDLYHNVLKLPRGQADVIQVWHEALLRPFLYEPVAMTEGTGAQERDQGAPGGANDSLRADAQRAAELYQRVFDQPINRAERGTIVRAVQSTWNRDLATQAWQAVDDREILLLNQDLTIAEHGDTADVELHEAYQNKTSQRQEVVYYFSLPESAVITGVWLGESPDRSRRYAWQVAPRGAAQSVYRNEVRRNVDPALVEQIGPRQYRLRVFPIEPPRWRPNTATGLGQTLEPQAMHVWLTYRVLADGNSWPLPRLADKRNVYWDGSTTRTLNGQPMTVGGDAWLPASAPATSAPQPAAHRADFEGGLAVVAEPYDAADDAIGAAAPLRLAVVLDRSRSMAPHAARVQAALDRLKELQAGANPDVYLTASEYRGEGPSMVSLEALKPEQLTCYGGQSAADLLRQFAALRGERTYDAVLVLTDSSGYELGAAGSGGKENAMATVAPVWMVHLDGGLSLGYDDATLEAIQASGGGATDNVDEAVRRARAALAGRASQAEQADVVDGYAWRVMPAAATPAAPAAQSPDDPFAALAARRLILSETARRHDQLGQLGALDALHEIAVQRGIVTPYSSMIVLVNEAQKQRLAEAEKRGDRFERELEQVGETVPEGNQTVAAVPEPEEWLLIAVAAGLLGWVVWRRRFTPGSRPV